MSKLADFLSELKHRRVYRVAVVYAGVAFIISEIVANTIGFLNLPDSFGTAVIVILIIGFPIVIGLAWAFDITDEGIVRAKGRPADAKRKAQPLLGNKSLAVIAVLAIIVAVWALLRGPSLGGAAIRSIAVLPLANLSDDPGQEHLVEKIHDSIISSLNHLQDIEVRSRTSTLIYADTDKQSPEIARELNVDALVEGTVFRAENQVIISIQLIHGASDDHLWDSEYVLDLSDILIVYRDIVDKIAREIGLVLSPEEETYLAGAQQVNPKAYDLYSQGWHFHNLTGSESRAKAVEYLEQAVSIDSTFAEAWAALAHSYFLLNFASDSDLALDLMKQATDKALDLDPNQPLAHAVLGSYRWWTNDFAGAEASGKRALDLDPSLVWGRYQYGIFLLRTGRPNEGLAEFRFAQELDPNSPSAFDGFALFYDYTRQYDKALEYYQLSDERLYSIPRARPRLEREIFMQEGRYAEVAEQVGVNTILGMRARMAMGNVEEVHAFLDSQYSSGEYEQENPISAASRYAIIGEKDKALELLDRAFPDTFNSWQSIWLIYDIVYDSLRAEPRFKALLRKLGLTEVFDENGNLLQSLDETLEAYNAPGSR